MLSVPSMLPTSRSPDLCRSTSVQPKGHGMSSAERAFNDARSAMPPLRLPVELTLRLRPVSWAATRARHAVHEFCIERGMSDIADDAALLTSELVTNAIRYASLVVTLRVVQRDANLIVTITDDADGVRVVQPLPPAPTASSGRGLFVVNELAADWGITSKDGETTAWFRLP
jgi:anti-sigma regulatory factor (Ser/Thr protein kinase)